MNKIDVFLLLVCGAFLGITFWYLIKLVVSYPIKLLMEEKKYRQAEMVREIVREEMKKR